MPIANASTLRTMLQFYCRNYSMRSNNLIKQRWIWLKSHHGHCPFEYSFYFIGNGKMVNKLLHIHMHTKWKELIKQRKKSPLFLLLPLYYCIRRWQCWQSSAIQREISNLHVLFISDPMNKELTKRVYGRQPSCNQFIAQWLLFSLHIV